MAETRAAAKGRHDGEFADTAGRADTREEEFQITRSKSRRASRPPGPHAVAGCLTRLWPMADPAVTALTLSPPQECGNTASAPICDIAGPPCAVRDTFSVTARRREPRR